LTPFRRQFRRKAFRIGIWKDIRHLASTGGEQIRYPNVGAGGFGAVGGVKARSTQAFHGGRLSVTVFQTISTSTRS
jgi:hypothetical protein